MQRSVQQGTKVLNSGKKCFKRSTEKSDRSCRDYIRSKPLLTLAGAGNSPFIWSRGLQGWILKCRAGRIVPDAGMTARIESAKSILATLGGIDAEDP